MLLLFNSLNVSIIWSYVVLSLFDTDLEKGFPKENALWMLKCFSLRFSKTYDYNKYLNSKTVNAVINRRDILINNLCLVTVS